MLGSLKFSALTLSAVQKESSRNVSRPNLFDQNQFSDKKRGNIKSEEIKSGKNRNGAKKLHLLVIYRKRNAIYVYLKEKNHQDVCIERTQNSADKE